jgi:hypothetical protein
MLGRSRRSPCWTAAAVALTLIALAAGPAIAGGVSGRISAFDLTAGRFLGQLRNQVGQTVEIDGIWGLERSPVFTSGVRLLYFSAGPNGGSNGLIGTLHTGQGDGFQRRHFGAIRERASDGRNPGRAHH